MNHMVVVLIRVHRSSVDGSFWAGLFLLLVHLTCDLNVMYALDSGGDSYRVGGPSTTNHTKEPQVKVVSGNRDAHI